MGGANADIIYLDFSKAFISYGIIVYKWKLKKKNKTKTTYLFLK